MAAFLHLFVGLLWFHCVTCQDVCDNRAILSRLNALETQVEMQNNEINALKQQLGVGVEDTYFLASINAYETAVGANEIIPWNLAAINPGGHFDLVTYGYRAPVNGIYQFTVALRTRSEGPDFQLLIGNSVYYYYQTWAKGTHESGAATTIVELTAGQLVRVRTIPARTVAGGARNEPYYYFSWFSGFLLTTS